MCVCVCVCVCVCAPGVEGKATCQRALILCPSSLVVNWGNELKKWIGQDKVCPVVSGYTHTGTQTHMCTRTWTCAWSMHVSGFPEACMQHAVMFTRTELLRLRAFVVTGM